MQTTNFLLHLTDGTPVGCCCVLLVKCLLTISILPNLMTTGNCGHYNQMIQWFQKTVYIFIDTLDVDSCIYEIVLTHLRCLTDVYS